MFKNVILKEKMSIWAIADLHLSFGTNKPMNIFGDNWKNHETKIQSNWLKNVKEEDTVILPGDFSWATYISEAKLDFEYLNKLPGKKILLKGNHDYWWTTLNKMNEFVKENKFKNIQFLYNNSILVEDKIIVGTRGWTLNDTEESQKMINRENERLKLSIKNAIDTYGTEKELIAFMHYPPISSKNISIIDNDDNKNNINCSADSSYIDSNCNKNSLNSNYNINRCSNRDTNNSRNLQFYNTLKQYKIKKCYYGHLHGSAHSEAVEGNVGGIEFHLISADFLDFKLNKVKD